MTIEINLQASGATYPEATKDELLAIKAEVEAIRSEILAIAGGITQPAGRPDHQPSGLIEKHSWAAERWTESQPWSTAPASLANHGHQRVEDPTHGVSLILGPRFGRPGGT